MNMSNITFQVLRLITFFFGKRWQIFRLYLWLRLKGGITIGPMYLGSVLSDNGGGG